MRATRQHRPVDPAMPGDPADGPLDPDAAMTAAAPEAPAQRPLNRAERRGQRRGRPSRPSGQPDNVRITRPVGRGRDPRLPRR